MQLIETKRTYTKLWTKNDTGSLRLIFCDPDMMKFLGGPLSETKLETALQFFLDHYSKHGFGPVSVITKDTNIVIGILGLKYLSYSKNIDLGFSVIKSHWNQGFGTEIAAAGLDYAFNVLNQNKIDAICHPNNQASRHTLENIGMKFESEILFRGVKQVVYTALNL